MNVSAKNQPPMGATPLIPPVDSRSVYYDIFNAGLLFALAFLLLPAWRKMGSDYQLEVVGQMASPMLPAALGFLLVLRSKAVDLSIWAVMGVGGLVAAWLINMGVWPVWAFGAAVFVGGAIGLVSGLLTVSTRLPSVIITAVIGAAIIGGMWAVDMPAAVEIPAGAFDSWVVKVSNILGSHLETGMLLSAPMLTFRMLLVAGAWGTVMLIMLLSDMHVVTTQRMLSRRKKLLISLCASGALSALAGACWLMDYGQSPTPTRLVDDLTIPAAALMAGGMFLRGRGRTMLAGICLPIAMLVTSLWQQLVWPTQVMGYSRQMFLLVAMIIQVQLAFIWIFDCPRRQKRMSIAACGVSLLGLCALAYATRLESQNEWIQYIAGTGVWAIGCIAMAALMIQAERITKRRKNGNQEPGKTGTGN